ncbi:NAD(P)/FAD-dependent oxidoreductase [Afifella pfennigii]|uniref:NAD(P)/FAD-dependent oxidoreductase n=1 Tax=Afifella pfennigii TaxID=209897 RepID=UPI00068C1CA3|nr:FAD-binding oxidoreductase [Afifella pfennigii]
MSDRAFQDRLNEESLWVRTAGAAPEFPALAGDADCDVAVIGAGLLGLSTALSLAEAGASVIVLEAGEPGWGSGGRNGGQVNPGLKIDPNETIRHFGEARGGRLVDFAGGVAEETFDTIRRLGIDCDASQKGWLQLAHTSRALAPLQRRAQEWQARGVAVEVLSASRLSEITGSEAYFGGILHPSGGGVHPLKLVRGLAEAAVARGAAVHGRSPVVRIVAKGGRPVLETPQGRVRAERVLVATNAYTGGQVPRLERDLLPVSTFQVASEPLPPHLAGSILPSGHHVSDTHRSLYYFRKDRDGRFLIGGRGAYKARGVEGAYAELRRVAGRIFPALAQVRWEHRWGGMVGVTEDHLPHIGEPVPGVLAAVGFNGRGLALGVALGPHLARYLAGGPERDMPLPVRPLAPIRFHGIKVAALPLAAGIYGLLDRLDGGRIA